MKSLTNVYIFIGLFVVYTLYRFLPKSAVHVPKDDSESTLTDQEALSMANSLHIAMNQLGTDEQSIFSIFNGVSPYDYAKISNKFGLRHYDPDAGFNAFGTFDTLYGLSQWLKNELSNSEIQILQSQFQQSF